MNTDTFPKQITRSALIEALPGNDESSLFTTRVPAFTYVPASHAKALDPDNTIVEGIRGAGKSHWWAVLNSKPHRSYLAAVFPEARIGTNLKISHGFGTGLTKADAPSKDALESLTKKYSCRNIWKAVIATHLEFPAPFPSKEGKWSERVKWISENPEDYDELLEEADCALLKAKQLHLVLFDALDRLANDWTSIRPLAKALFQLALDIRSCRAIRIKLFVRPDMIEDKEILAFPDSSKLLARKVTLTWRSVDLYALLFQCLGNAQNNGEEIRSHFKKHYGLSWKEDHATNTWILPSILRTDEVTQRNAFHAIAGPAMGSGNKRGYPYTWLPNHLLDGRDQVSPRSFSAALRRAAAGDLPHGWEFPLHYKSIQTGVQAASQIRVAEVFEDYPWVKSLIEPLSSISVPCEVDQIMELWSKGDVIKTLKNESILGDVKLPPPRLGEGGMGVLVDLEDLGIVQQLSDGRIQMPDVYRIAFGLGRRGGVKPLR